MYRTAQNKQFGLVNQKGEIVLPCKYKDIYLLSKELGLLLVMDDEFMIGLRDRDGKEIVPCKYTHIGEFSPEGYAIVRIKKAEGYINSAGKEIVPCKYKTVYPIEEDGTLQVQQTDGLVIRTKIEN